MRPSAMPILQRCSCGGSSDHETNALRGRPSGSTVTPLVAPPRPWSLRPASTRRSPAAGRPFPGGARREMEAFFGQNFGDIRLHHDASAARSAADVGARAYTVGPHVVFGSGGYAPGTDARRGLLAHELTHVLQPHGAPGPAGGPISIASQDAHICPKWMALGTDTARAGDPVRRATPPTFRGLGPSSSE
jgi:hypothetical protein